MRVSLYCVTLAILACASSVAMGANTDNGSTLAKCWCTGCHIVSADQAKGTLLIVRVDSSKPDFNVEKIASFLLEPHPKMPNIALSPEEVKDISAVIAEQPR